MSKRIYRIEITDGRTGKRQTWEIEPTDEQLPELSHFLAKLRETMTPPQPGDGPEDAQKLSIAHSWLTGSQEERITIQIQHPWLSDYLAENLGKNWRRPGDDDIPFRFPEE